jgi:hypothetical protein
VKLSCGASAPLAAEAQARLPLRTPVRRACGRRAGARALSGRPCPARAAAIQIVQPVLAHRRPCSARRGASHAARAAHCCRRASHAAPGQLLGGAPHGAGLLADRARRRVDVWEQLHPGEPGLTYDPKANPMLGDPMHATH